MVFFFRKNVRIDKHVPENLKDEYAEIMSLFKSCDANKDGKLSWEEVKAGFRELQSRWPAYRAHRAFHIADKNGDGYINEAELDELVKYVLGCYKGKHLPKGVHRTCQRKMCDPLPLTEAQLRSIFKLSDSNRDGRLSLGSHLPGWRAGRGLSQADGNGDGYVSDEELDHLVKYALKCGYTKYIN
ncbi:hypothetical protein PTKIN_Ptkin09bG0135200 [Pterospermum kingtungense]